MTAVDVLAEHAYDLAFRACKGRRVAVLAGDGAPAAVPGEAGLEATVVDVEGLAEGVDGFEAVVLVRSPRDPAPSEDAIAGVRRLAGGGKPVIVSLPAESDERKSGEGGKSRLETLLAGAGRVTVVELNAGSGSLIGPAGAEEGTVAVSIEGSAEGPPAALVAFANVDPPTLDEESAVRIAPAQGPPLEALERSVRALERANRSLARPALSRRTSAAASEIHRSTRLERRLLHLHRESPWVTLPLRIARGLARRVRALLSR
jgi:hypothetical protein